MTREEIARVISQTVEITVRRVMRELAPSSDEISVSEAQRLYGYSEVRALIRENRISTRRIGTAKNSKIILSKSEILTALASYTAL